MWADFDQILQDKREFYDLGRTYFSRKHTRWLLDNNHYCFLAKSEKYAAVASHLRKPQDKRGILLAGIR